MGGPIGLSIDQGGRSDHMTARLPAGFLDPPRPTGLRTAFIGIGDDFNQILVHWLSQRSEVTRVVWTDSMGWQRSMRGRYEFAARRRKRYGLRKVVDESLMYLWRHYVLLPKEAAAIRRNILEPYYAVHGRVHWDGPQMFTKDPNAPDVLEFLGSGNLDAAFASCIHDFFTRELRDTASKGLFLWHEGITPEYKGLYSPFWAIHNLELDKIGYTMLRTGDKLDAGEIFVQGTVPEVDLRLPHVGYIGYQAVVASLPEVQQFLVDLEQGRARPIPREGAESNFYTYPGLSDYLRFRKRLRTVAAG